MIINDKQWKSMKIYDNRWWSMIINDNQWKSKKSSWWDISVVQVIQVILLIQVMHVSLVHRCICDPTYELFSFQCKYIWKESRILLYFVIWVKYRGTNSSSSWATNLVPLPQLILTSNIKISVWLYLQMK